MTGATGLWNVLLFVGLMVGAVGLMVWEFNWSAKKAAARDADRIKRAGQP